MNYPDQLLVLLKDLRDPVLHRLDDLLRRVGADRQGSASTRARRGGGRLAE